jgi:hypothetical protein
MGSRNRSWQDVDYVLSYFGKTPGRAKNAYYSYVEAGLEQGRRKELTGGGLIRSLFCYWSVRELGIPLTELAGRLGISVPAVGYSVERGEIIARENDYQLIE